jgi:hypothetical protein
MYKRLERRTGLPQCLSGSVEFAFGEIIAPTNALISLDLGPMETSAPCTFGT